MRAALPSAAATASLLRLLLAVMLVLGAVQWSPAPAAAASGGPVSSFVAAESIADIVLPREAALLVERKGKKNASGPAPLDCGLAQSATSLHPISRWTRADPTRASPSSGLPSQRPEARAPPLTI